MPGEEERTDMATTDTKERAHELIERLPASQLAAVVGLLEAILDPVARALANAPIDDEPVTEEERIAVDEAREWSKHHPGIPFEQVLSDFDLTIDDLKAASESE
jgi:hypothetical protein